MTRESTWPDGRSYDVWRMYFEKDGEVACRLCLPHPIALVKDRRTINFNPTIDVNVVSNFRPNEAHLVTNPDEVAMIELSPPDKEFLLTTTMRVRLDAGGSEPSIPPFYKMTHSRQRSFYGQKIIIRGSGGDCGDREMVARLLNGQ